jgi:hypothetical protein
MPWHLASPSIIIYRQFDQQVFVYLLIDGEIIIDQIVAKQVLKKNIHLHLSFVLFLFDDTLSRIFRMLFMSTFVFRYYRTSRFFALWRSPTSVQFRSSFFRAIVGED